MTPQLSGAFIVLLVQCVAALGGSVLIGCLYWYGKDVPTALFGFVTGLWGNLGPSILTKIKDKPDGQEVQNVNVTNTASDPVPTEETR